MSPRAAVLGQPVRITGNRLRGFPAPIGVDSNTRRMTRPESARAESLVLLWPAHRSALRPVPIVH